MKKIIFAFIIFILIVIMFVCFNKPNIVEENLANDFYNIKYEVNEEGKYDIYDEDGSIKFENVEENMLKFYEDNPDFEGM